MTQDNWVTIGTTAALIITTFAGIWWTNRLNAPKKTPIQKAVTDIAKPAIRSSKKSRFMFALSCVAAVASMGLVYRQSLLPGAITRSDVLVVIFYCLLCAGSIGNMAVILSIWRYDVMQEELAAERRLREVDDISSPPA